MKRLLLAILCISSIANANAHSTSNQEWHTLVELMQKWHTLGRDKWLHKESSNILLKKNLQEDLKKLATLSNASEYQQELSDVLKEQKTKISKGLCKTIKAVAIAGAVALASGFGFYKLLPGPNDAIVSDKRIIATIVLMYSCIVSSIITLCESGNISLLQQEKSFLKGFINFVQQEEQTLFGQKNTLPTAA